MLHVGGNDLDGKSAPDPRVMACDLQQLVFKLLAVGVSQSLCVRWSVGSGAEILVLRRVPLV